MADGVTHQMREVLAKAGKEAATAPNGSPAQQVGTLHIADLNVAARNAAGVAPTMPHPYDIDALQSFDDLTQLNAKCAECGGPTLFVLPQPSVDFVDNIVYVFSAADGGENLPDSFGDVCDKANGDLRITSYRSCLIDGLKITGAFEAEAVRIADLSIKTDRRLRAGTLIPSEKVDLRSITNPETLRRSAVAGPATEPAAVSGNLEVSGARQGDRN